VIRAVLRFFRVLPARLEQAHLEWALTEISPLHPDVPYIVHRIHRLKDTR
jgi:hypothetical protein